MTQPTKFIVTGQGRCGSNLLKFALKKHPKIEMVGEYYNARVFPESTSEPGNLRARAYFDGAGPKTAAIGFKIFSHHAVGKPERRVWRYLASKNIFVIHLVRVNTLERLISLKVAEESQAWVASADKEALHDSITLHLPPDQWLAEIEADIAADERLAMRFKDNKYLRVIYEELIENWDDEIARIQDFLRVKRLAVEPTLKKQEKRTKRERLENYEEVVDYFEGTDHAWMFD